MNKASRANFCKSSAGTAMVELAIILPLLLFIVFGVTELGRALYQQNMLTQAVELGGRYMARVEDAVNADCSNGDNWAGAVIEAKNLIEFGCSIGDDADECDTPVVPNLESDNILFDVCGPDDSDEPCTSPSACVIVVRATADFQSIFGGDLVSVPGYRLGGVTLNAATQERYIGY